MTMRGKPRNASAICTVGVGRSQSRGSSLTLRKKCRSRPELKQIPAPLVMTALISPSARTMSSASNHAATSASFRQLRLSGRLRTTRATPASASCSRISSGQALSVRHVSVITVLLLVLFQAIGIFRALFAKMDLLRAANSIYSLPLVGRVGWGSGGDTQSSTYAQNLATSPLTLPTRGRGNKRHDQRIEREAAARQHDKRIDIDRLHDVAQLSAMRPSAISASITASISRTGDER